MNFQATGGENKVYSLTQSPSQIHNLFLHIKKSTRA